MTDKEFIEFALNSKFYQRKLKGLKLARFTDVPLTTKQELRECDVYDVIGTAFDNIATYHETSGTTGKPTPSWYSHKDVDQEAQVIIDSQLGLNRDDLLLNRFPFALAIPSFILYWACTRVRAGHIAVDKASMVTPYARVVEIMERTRPTIVAMLPSEAEIIAESCKRKGVTLPTPHLRTLFVAGELVSAKRKEYLEQSWGVPVIGFFGSTETGGLFVTCKDGHYHLNHPNVKIEVVDKNHQPLNYGARGYCVISSAREGMPLLRYFNHDLIELREGSSCGCGSDHPILIHYGREDDFVNMNGREISFLDIQDVVYTMPIVPFLWNIRVHPDHLMFEYQLSTGVSDPTDLISNMFELQLTRQLGVPVRAKPGELITDANLTTKPAYSKFNYLIRSLEVCGGGKEGKTVC